MNAGNLGENHRHVRECLALFQSALGAPAGIGWEDEIDLDPSRFEETYRRLRDVVRRHEALDRELRAALTLAGDAQGAAAVQNQAAEIDEDLRLLSATAATCDGRHVYALRSVLSRLAENLARHLADHERLSARARAGGES